MSIITMRRDLGLMAGIKSMWTTDSSNQGAKFLCLSKRRRKKLHQSVPIHPVDWAVLFLTSTMKV